uniref:CSON006673 protein n=1 Tax=Culicoides sonorensis TaxID=179676 RepID=A0A336MTP5_CULSO
MVFKFLFITLAVLAMVNLNNAAPNPNLCPDDPRCQEPFPARVVRSPKPQCDLNDPTRVDRRYI